jgi:hypothetical protein
MRERQIRQQVGCKISKICFELNRQPDRLRVGVLAWTWQASNRADKQVDMPAIEIIVNTLREFACTARA